MKRCLLFMRHVDEEVRCRGLIPEQSFIVMSFVMSGEGGLQSMVRSEREVCERRRKGEVVAKSGRDV